MCAYHHSCITVYPSTVENKPYLFSNFATSPKQPSLLVSVLEDHTNDTPQTVENTLCVINVSAKSVSFLKGITKADFFAAPTFSPDGTKLTWVQWYHPDMPWEGTELYVADVAYSDDTFHVVNAKQVAGEKLNISVAYPTWADDNTLVFMSDISGHYNPWKYSVATHVAKPIFPSPVSEDFARPPWVLGGSPYALVSGTGTGLFTAFRDGANVLYFVDLNNPTQPREVSPCPFAVISSVRSIAPGKPEFIFAALKSDGPGGIIQCNLQVGVGCEATTYTVLKSTAQENSATASFPPKIISLPISHTFFIAPENEPLHVVLYKPINPEYEGSSVSGERPPCILNAHGGKYVSFI